jgi:hypothetical protein
MKTLLAMLMALAAATAGAHDTWFEPVAEGQVVLGTGNQFPKRESAIDPQYVARSGCLGPKGPAALAAGEVGETGLAFSAGAASCWVQLAPFEITLAPDKIALYLREVRPPADLLALWSKRLAQGLPWRERYTKHARITLPGAGAAAAQPSGMDLDVLVEGESPRVFQVLRDGRPFAGFAVELRHEDSPFGVWRRTDDQGRVSFVPPLPGRWLLRGVDLQPGPDDTWDSRFVTLAFEAAPPVRAAAARP